MVYEVTTPSLVVETTVTCATVEDVSHLSSEQDVMVTVVLVTGVASVG